jgi:vacuolar protein-sorting-associated protein 4
MNWQSVTSGIKYDLEKFERAFRNADDEQGQRNAISNYIGVINHIDRSLKGEVPNYQRSILENYLSESKRELAEMEKNVGNVGKKVLVEGGGKGKSDGKEDDSLSSNILDTIIGEKPNVKWDDIAGLFEAKKSLNEALIMPIKYPNFFVGNVQPWKGILLYGPPGTGKTFIAKACATECDSTFFSVSSSDLMSKYMGESEKMIKELFKIANKKAPSIIFIDEIDSMCGNRSDSDSDNVKRIKSEFLVQMQGVGNNNEKVLVLGATNLPWALDPAIRRRFERRILIPLPDLEARMYLIRQKLKGLDKNLNDKDLEHIAAKTEGFSGSDIEILCRDAAFEPLHLAQRTNKFRRVIFEGKEKFIPVPPTSNGQDCITSSVYDLPNNSLLLPDLTREDLEASLLRSKSSVSKDDLKQYDEWTRQFGVSD